MAQDALDAVDVGDVVSVSKSRLVRTLQPLQLAQAAGEDKRMASGVFSKDRLQPVADRNPSRNQVAQSGWRPALPNFPRA